MKSSIFYSKIDASEIRLNKIEVAARLKTSIDYSDDLVEKCKARLISSLSMGYSAVLCDVEVKDGFVSLEGTKIQSAALSKNLCRCDMAFIIAVSLGVEVDRLLNRLSVTSPAEHFITDALASAYADSLCDYVATLLGKNYVCSPCFAVGYADLSLSYQEFIVSETSADRLLGLCVGKNKIISPSKSITAFMGISNK